MFSKFIFVIFTYLFFSIPVYAENNTFSLSSLSPALQKQMISNGIWQKGCPVSLDDLRLLKVNYYNFSGEPKTGEIILNKSVAENALQAFEELYTKKFSFSNISTLISSKGDINRAKENNISYGFICKKDNQQKYSTESYGNIITVNPVQNPEIDLVWKKSSPSEPFLCHYLYLNYFCRPSVAYISQILIIPSRGMLSVNRNLKLAGMNETSAPIFAKYGFIWSGLNTEKINWNQFVK